MLTEQDPLPVSTSHPQPAVSHRGGAHSTCVCAQAYKDSGDTAAKKGDRIWIAEMYGYSFGAAKANVWHKWADDFMLYPSYTPPGEQRLHA